jgi:hypothetical protein
VVAGEPRVPISLWRTAATDLDQPGQIGERLAHAIVTSYAAVADPVLDLTHGSAIGDACHRAGRRHTRLEQPDSDHQVALVVAERPETGPHDSHDAAVVAIAAARLASGGCLVLIDAATATPVDHRPLHAAAAAVGLTYLQHIVAVAATADGDRFVYYPTREELADATDPNGSGHVRVHRDIRVYLRTGGDARA